MNQLDYFLAAMRAELYRRRSWVISAFSLVREGPDDVARVVGAYRGLLRGAVSAGDLRRALRTEGGYGVVTGSLRVITG